MLENRRAACDNRGVGRGKARRGEIPSARACRAESFSVRARRGVRAAGRVRRGAGRSKGRQKIWGGPAARRGGKALKDYQEVILFLYPRLERAAEDIAQIVEAGALASVSGKESAERCAGRLLGYLQTRECFLAVRDAVDGMRAQLSEEERFLLEYKYFRRKGVLQGEFRSMDLDCSLRTYYRKQDRLARRMNALFLRAGLTETWFAETLGGLPFFASALRCLRARRGALVDKRARRELTLRRK